MTLSNEPYDPNVRLPEEPFFVELRPGLSIHGTGPQRAALFAAMANAKASFGSIAKDRHVRVDSPNGRSYEFDYATLDAVLSATDAALSRAGLCVLDVPTDSELVTMLTHCDGGFLQSVQSLPATKEQWDRDTKERRQVPLTIQDIGSAITYRRRYARQCILGVAAEEDDDGNAAVGGHVENRQLPPTPRKEPSPAQIAAPPAGEQKTFSTQDIAALHQEIQSLLRALGIREPRAMQAELGALAGGQEYARNPKLLLEMRAALKLKTAPAPKPEGT